MRQKRKSGNCGSVKRLRQWKNPPPIRNSSVLLLWIQSLSSPFSHLCKNITREIALYLTFPALLPAVYGDELYVVDVITMECRSSSTPFKTYDPVHFSYIDATSSICLTEQAGYILNMHTLEFTKLFNLPPGKGLPYVCYVPEGTLYLFRCNFPCVKVKIAEKEEAKLAKAFLPPGKLIFAFRAQEYIYIGVNSPQNLCSYYIFNLLTEELGPNIVLEQPTPPLTFDKLQIQTKNQLQILSLCSGGRKAACLWSWDYVKNLVETQVWSQKRLNQCPTYTYTLQIGDQVFWLDRWEPKLYSFDMKTRKMQWRTLNVAS